MKFPKATFVISTILLGLFQFFGVMPENLVWQQDANNAWQLISAHFVHISPDHLTWNLIAFAILGGFIEQHSIKRLLLSLGIGIVCVSLYLITLFDMAAYAGLSGVLNTLLVTALYQIAKTPGYRTAAIFSFIASTAKIFVELIAGQALFSSMIWPPVPEAHLAGLIGGIVFCLITHVKQCSSTALPSNRPVN